MYSGFCGGLLRRARPHRRAAALGPGSPARSSLLRRDTLAGLSRAGFLWSPRPTGGEGGGCGQSQASCPRLATLACADGGGRSVLGCYPVLLHIYSALLVARCKTIPFDAPFIYFFSRFFGYFGECLLHLQRFLSDERFSLLHFAFFRSDLDSNLSDIFSFFSNLNFHYQLWH